MFTNPNTKSYFQVASDFCISEKMKNQDTWIKWAPLDFTYPVSIYIQLFFCLLCVWVWVCVYAACKWHESVVVSQHVGAGSHWVSESCWLPVALSSLWWECFRRCSSPHIGQGFSGLSDYSDFVGIKPN